MVLVRAKVMAVLLLGSIAASGAAEPHADGVAIQEYLALLGAIEPAARAGAEAYMAAYQQKCGRPLSTVQLRRAVSEGDGDPILMRMVRAKYYQDEAELSRLAAQVPCDRP